MVLSTIEGGSLDSRWGQDTAGLVPINSGFRTAAAEHQRLLVPRVAAFPERLEFVFLETLKWSLPGKSFDLSSCIGSLSPICASNISFFFVLGALLCLSLGPKTQT